MCRYISVVVPGTVRMESLEVWALSLNLGFTRYENPHVRAGLQPGEILALATRGHCDCSSPVGSASNQPDDAAAAKVAADTRRMRRLGWSEAKIHRVLAQKNGASKRPKGAGGDGGAGLEEWAAFLRGARSHGHCERIGVLWHMYRGRIDEEDFPFVRARSRSISDLTLDDLARLKGDVLHEFTLSD
jgi:hypothetical protein